MADATGGTALINSNSFTETFECIVRDNSTYYMLGFNSTYDNDDGRYVRLEVRVKRPGLIVRTRGGYVAPTRAERRAKDEERTPVASSAESAALASPVTTDGLPLQVTAVPFHARGEARVALVMELDADALGLTFEAGVYSGMVDVSYVATDARRRIYSEVQHTASIRIEPTAGAPLPLDGVRVRILSELPLPEGRYQIRVGASAGAQAGCVVYDLEVPDFREGDLRLSGLALTTPAERHVLTLEADGPGGTMQAVKCYSERCGPPPTRAGGLRQGLAGATASHAWLPGPPTTAREFTAADAVVLAVEVYENRRARRGAPAHSIAAAVSLRAADGRVIPLTREERPSTAARTGSSGYPFALRLPLDDVPAGTYALRVDATSDAGEGRSVTREIPITVR